jgi:cell division septum initiation protein DivIVA
MASDRTRASTERKAAKVVDAARDQAQRLRAEAEADAARIRSEAEEHARRLVLDARATADGVRAEGMEVVSNLRLIGDSLRANSDQLLQDIERIHARMVGELEAVAPDGEVAPPSALAGGAPEPAVEDELDVPDFVQGR